MDKNVSVSNYRANLSTHASLTNIIETRLYTRIRAGLELMAKRDLDYILDVVIYEATKIISSIRFSFGVSREEINERYSKSDPDITLPIKAFWRANLANYYSDMSTIPAFKDYCFEAKIFLQQISDPSSRGDFIETLSKDVLASFCDSAGDPILPNGNFEVPF